MSEKPGAQHRSTRVARSGVKVVRGWGRDATTIGRLVLAGKAAAAAAIAWLLAPFVPFADSEYSYYAPLGVLVSMYPTIVGSFRAGAQSLLGLGLGIALGIGALHLVIIGLPAVIAIAIVIAAGIIIGGIDALGAGRDWVAIAALFVLLLGGGNVDDFSLSYLLTMAFGVIVGLLMNFLVMPPLYLGEASRRLTSLRDSVCDSLDRIADGVEDVSVDTERLELAVHGVDDALVVTIRQVRDAEESSRANPRSRRRRGIRQTNAGRLRALESISRATRDLADNLAQSVKLGASLPPAVRETMAAAVRASADVVAAAPTDERASELLEGASERLDEAVHAVHRESQGMEVRGFALAYSFAALISVRRIVEASREFVVHAGEKS